MTSSAAEGGELADDGNVLDACYSDLSVAGLAALLAQPGADRWTQLGLEGNPISARDVSTPRSIECSYG